MLHSYIANLYSSDNYMKRVLCH